MLWQLVVAAAVVGAAYYRWSRRRLYRLAREIPSGLKEYPIVGHAYKFLGSNKDRMNALQEFGRVANLQGGLSSVWLTHKLFIYRMNALQEFGRVANLQGGLSSVWLTHKLFICMTDPKAIEVVSKACLDKDEFTIKFTRILFGNASSFAPVNIWHSRRKINNPFYNIRNLSRMVPLFQEKSSIMADLIQGEVGSGDFSIWKYITTYTFDTIFESALGRKMNSQEDPDHFVFRAIDEMTHRLATRVLQPWLHPDFIYKRLPIYKRFQSHMQRCFDFIDEIIRSKRTELKAVESKGKNDRFINFLDAIIQSSGGEEKGYSDTELREETILIGAAGTAPSAVAVSFTAVLLSRYPDVQDRVYQELAEVFGNSDREVIPEDLPRLTYLEAVIKETMRLYPSVPVVVREVHNDVVLPYGPTLVDGTSIVINIWGTHRNPAYWGLDAEQFRPERFLEGPLRHPAQFIPFSYSLRNCVGTTYAMLSMKMVFANLLRRYQLLPPAKMAAEDLTKPLRLEYNLMMKDVDNYIVRIEERNGMNYNK